MLPHNLSMNSKKTFCLVKLGWTFIQNSPPRILPSTISINFCQLKTWFFSFPDVIHVNTISSYCTHICPKYFLLFRSKTMLSLWIQYSDFDYIVFEFNICEMLCIQSKFVHKQCQSINIINTPTNYEIIIFNLDQFLILCRKFSSWE